MATVLAAVTNVPSIKPLDYEAHLQRLYSAIREVFADHPEHPTRVQSISGEERGLTCKLDDRCDELNGLASALIDTEFRADVVAGQLMDSVQRVLTVEFDARATTVLGACVAAFRADAEARLFPAGACQPVNPAASRMPVTVVGDGGTGGLERGEGA